MALDTTKSVKSITYNGTEIPLASTASGDTSETWVLNEIINTSTKFSYIINFTSNNVEYTSISITGSKAPTPSGFSYSLKYDNTTILMSEEAGEFSPMNQSPRKLTFFTAPTGGLLTWLQANGVKQERNLAIQPSKSLTITSNGTTTITPDAPYDAMGRVDLTVNISNGGLEPATLTVNGADSYYIAQLSYLTPTGQIIKETASTTHDLPITISTVKNSLVNIGVAVGGGMLKLTNEHGCAKTPGTYPWGIVCTENVASVTIYNDD